MALISEFSAFGDRFEIEPPIEVGDHFIDSLGKLAMIAAKGYDYDPRILEAMAGSINNTLDGAYDRNGTDSFAYILTEFVAMRDRIHTFTRSE